MKNLSVVIPIFNEKGTVRDVILSVKKAALSGLGLEIVAVDDGSTDGSREELLTLEKEGHCRAVFHTINQGKGSAIRTGFVNVSGDYVIIQDADLEYNPKDYGVMIQPLIDGEAEVVYGSRFAGGKPHRVLFFWHYVGNKLLTLLSNIFTNLNLTDMETGYKAFTREVIAAITPSLHSRRFGIEPEITAKVAKHNFRVYEVGISYFGRTYKEGKKIGWKDGVSAIFSIIRFNLF
jgi:glycosyltransferase involved in cell wall biosynthesis